MLSKLPLRFQASDLALLLVTLPLLLAGALALAALFNASGRNRPDSTLARIKTYLLGRSRDQVERELGPPPTSAAANAPTEPEVWYYPLSSRARCAMAIVFTGNRAHAVQFLR